MNKKLLLILLAGLVLMAGFTLVYARHINKEATPSKAPAFRGDTRTLEEPAVPMVQRVRTGTLYEKPKSLEDLKNAAQKAGKPYTSPEDQMKADFDIQVQKIVTPAGIIDEGSLTECVIIVHNEPCCYYQPWPDYFDQYLNCVGTAEYWQLQDPQHHPASACGYPVYPFEVSQVQFYIHTPAPCDLLVEFAVTWDYGSIYWGFPFPYYQPPDWSSGQVTVNLPEAGSFMVTGLIPEEERPCYHVPFFARFWLLNSDDFTDGPDPVYCPDALYGFWLTGVYDQGSVRNQGYYYSDAYGGYYDIVDIKGGNMRLYAGGFTRDQNECELESLWYHKANFGEWECSEPVEEHLELCIVDIDTTVQPPDTTWGSYRLVEPVTYGYAPDGMPDFHQGVPNWCGPAALSNCLWWCFAGGFPWYIINNWYGVWDTTIPPQMIAELAECMETDAIGTIVDSMQSCIHKLNDRYGFWLTETTIVQPSFEDIEYQIRLSQDVILLLGFWTEKIDTIGWEYIWGHYDCIEPVYPDQDSCFVRIDTIGFNVSGEISVFDYELGLQPPPPPDSSVQWHQIWPAASYCQDWHQDRWVDNNDGILSYCDTLYMSLIPEREIQKKFHIEDVTRTMTLTLKPDFIDTFYLDIVSPPEPFHGDTLYWEPVVAETCSYWHVVWPPEYHCQVWHLSSVVDNGSGYLDFCDTVDFTDTSSIVRYFHVEEISTNITVKELIPVLDTIWGHWDCVCGVIPEQDSCKCDSIPITEHSAWYRLGGHYVTCSGVNWEFFLLSLSDPWVNGYCDGLTPGDSSGGVFYVHDHTLRTDPPLHYDAGNVSHDYYQIAFDSPSPGGILWIPYYEWYDPVFYGMNFTPELEPFRAPGPDPVGAVVTEIEYAVVVCPGKPFVTDYKDSWNMFIQTSNYGEEGIELYTWQYYPEMANDGFEGSVICGTNPNDLALSVTQVGEDIKWFPTTPLNVTYYYYDDVPIEQLDANFYHNHPTNKLPVEVDYLGIGLDPAEGVLAGHPLGDMVIEKFVVHNTGEGIIPDSLEWAIFFDWDVNYDYYISANPSFGGQDMATNTLWGYDITREDKVVYLTLAPTHEGQIPRNMMIFDQNSDIYDHVPCGPYDSLKARMEMVGCYFPPVPAEDYEWYDYAYLMTSEKFVLDSCEKILQEYLIWYDWQIPSTDYTAYRRKLYRLLRGAGFYRGDVGDFVAGAGSPGILDITDIVYLVNYLFRNGPPPEPFIDQGDVNCDGETNIEDVVYLINYLLKVYGPPPIDKDRFYNEHSPWPEYQLLFSRPSLFADPQWATLGVGCL